MQKLNTKNLIIFIYKKSFGQILHKDKAIYIKISTTLLCAIFGTKGRNGITHNIFKIQPTKVVGFFTRNPTRLSLHFSIFSMIFYGFYKNQQQV
jgi:hypothetical protein